MKPIAFYKPTRVKYKANFERSSKKILNLSLYLAPKRT